MRTHVPTPHWFVLRTPLLPFDHILNWAGLTDGVHQSADDRAAVLREGLRRYLARGDLREAVFLASPTLVEHIEAYERGVPASAGMESAFVAYLMRACARPTPFGLFAGYSLGRIGTRTRLSLDRSTRYRRHTQLHAVTVGALVRTLETRLLRHLSYCANSSLFTRGSYWYYIEGLLHGSERRHHYVRVAASAPLTAVINTARQPTPFEDLVDAAYAACQDTGALRGEADAFVETLIANDILVSSLRPPCTGEPPLAHIIGELGRVSAAAREHEILQQIARELSTIDRHGVGRSSADYAAPAASVRTIDPGLQSCGYHVDLIKRSSNLSLGGNVVAAIGDAIEVLHAIASDMRDARLEAFAAAFPERFGDAEVPLLDALDDEVGVGFGDGAIEDLGLSPPFEFPVHRLLDDIPAWTARDQYLNDRIQCMAESDGHTLVLSDQDVQQLTIPNTPPLPSAFHVDVTIAAADEHAIDRGQFEILIQHIVGPSGARMLGRFGHRDRAMRTLIASHLQAEAQSAPETIYAEIVHMPDDVVGNIVARPVFRSYEIPFLGASGAPPEQQIPVRELMVSVVNGVVQLRWPRVNARVVPRLTSAHNYFQRRPMLYRFLCALQMQGSRQPAMWMWGALQALPFLPRVTYRRTVLSRARWRLNPGEIDVLRRTTGSDVRDRRLEAWRRQRGIPRFVRLMSGDQELLIDFENPLSVGAFLHYTRAERPHLVWEQFPSIEQCCVTGEGGRFLHEMFLLYVRQPSPPIARNDPPRVSARREAKPARTAERPSGVVAYPPGGEWVYAKLYTAHRDLDDLLQAAVSDVIEPARASQRIDQWFFVRYADPLVHLRLRLHTTAAPVPVLEAVLSWAGGLASAQAVSRVQLDTYQPEIHRYGGPEGLALMHEIFSRDSDAAAALIALARRDGSSWMRAAVTLLSLDGLLDDFELFGDQRSETLVALTRDLMRQVPVDREVKRALGRMFREERARMRAFLDAEGGEARARVATRSLAVRATVRRLRAAEERGLLSRPVSDMVPSLMHMNVNRLLRRPRLEHELILYDLLGRLDRERSVRPVARD